MTWLLTAVTSRMAGPIASGIAVLLAVTLAVVWIGAQRTERALAKAEAALATAEANLTTCRGNTSALQGALDRQGASVAALKAEGERRAAEASEAVLRLRGEVRRAETAAARIMAAQPGPDACVSAMAILRGEAG